MSYRKKSNFEEKNKKRANLEKQENVVHEVIIDKDKGNVDRILVTETKVVPEKRDFDENISQENRYLDDKSQENRYLDDKSQENRYLDDKSQENRYLDDKSTQENIGQPERQNFDEKLSSVNKTDQDKEIFDESWKNKDLGQPERHDFNENLSSENKTDENLDKDINELGRLNLNENVSPVNKKDENWKDKDIDQPERQNFNENVTPINKIDENWDKDVNQPERQNVNENVTPINKTDEKWDKDINQPERQNVNENLSPVKLDENFNRDIIQPERQNLDEKLSPVNKTDQENKNLDENRNQNTDLQERQNFSPVDRTSKDKQNLDENWKDTNIDESEKQKNKLDKDYSTDKEKQTLDENLSPIKTDKEKQNVSTENRDEIYKCSHSDKESADKRETKLHKRHGRKMDSLICNSYEMLHEYFDVKYQLPFDLFRSCTGIMFLRLWKGGFFLGGIGGTGLVMAHKNDTWSPPCAVSVGGLQIGFQVGIERVDDILLLHDDAALKLFIENGHFRLGFDASIAVGTFGRDSNMGVVMSEGGESKSIYSYSFAKGAFIGLSLDGGTLSIDDKVNEEFYGRKIGIQEIFYGNLTVPQQNEDLNKIQELLNSFSSQKTGTKESDLQNVSKPEVSLH